jgi:hypothetical protein
MKVQNLHVKDGHRMVKKDEQRITKAATCHRFFEGRQ